MPFVQAKCPECGGMLAVDDSKKAALCQFCGEAFIVQEAINNYITNNITNNNTTNNYGEGSVVNVYENSSKDFVIEAGVLKEYHGESTEIVIPDNVTTIAPNFTHGLPITKISIPSSITKIEGPFLESDNEFDIDIVIDENNQNFVIENDCLIDIKNKVLIYGKKNIENITFPNDVEIIGKKAFIGCSLLQELIIPKTIKKIEFSAFSGCKGLKKVVFPNNSIQVGPYAFEDCVGITKLELPSNITFCKSLELPPTNRAFKGCSNVRKLKTSLQYDFTEIGLEVDTLGVLEIIDDGKIYLRFNNIQELIIHKNVNSFPNIQNFSETLKKISMPFEISLKNVENRTFNCDNLESIEIVCDKFNETIDNQILSLVRGIKRILTNYKFKVIIKNAPKSLMWKIDNRCQHCGGQFKTTIFLTEKCKNCGKKRDY